MNSYCTLQFSEILNFDQDDLLSDDVLILDTPYEVVTWVGHSCTLEQKLNAKILSQVYVCTQVIPTYVLCD